MTSKSPTQTTAGRRWLRRVGRWSRRLCWTGVALAALLLAAWWFLPSVALYPQDLSYSRMVLDREGRLLHLTISADGKYRLPTRLDEVSPAVVRATLEKEDRRFYSHHGVDAVAVARAS